MKKKLFIIFSLIICLILLLITVSFFIKRTPKVAVRLYNQAPDYTVTYRPTTEFNTFLKDLTIFKPRSIFQTFAEKSQVKVFFLPYQKEDLKQHGPSYLEVSSLTESPTIYSLTIAPNIELWKSHTDTYNSNMLLSSIVAELIKRDQSGNTQLQTADKTAALLKNFASKPDSNPFTIKIKK